MRRVRAPGWFLLAWIGAVSSCADSRQEPTAPLVVVEEATHTFVDTSRPSMPHGDFPGAPERTLVTRLWFPDRPPRDAPACRSGSGCGLVVLAHGYTGRTERFDSFASGLAAAGWVVAAPTFPETSQDAPGGAVFTDVVEQPADVSFVVRGIRSESAGGTLPLADRIDPTWAAVVGHSLGGATALGATRVSCCADGEIDAVVLVAPATIVMPLFAAPIRAAGPPTLIIQGSVDPVVSPSDSRRLFAGLDPPRALLELTGASHSDLIENAPEPGAFVPPALAATQAFLASIRSGSGGPLTEAAAELRRAGHVVELDPGDAIRSVDAASASILQPRLTIAPMAP